MIKYKRFWILVVLAGVAVAVLTAATAHRTTLHSSNAPLVIHLHEVDTSVVPVDNPPKGNSAGDLIEFMARISSGGKPFGRYVGNCAYASKTVIFCSVDMTVYGQGRIEIQGEFSTQKADSVFPITGGSGKFARARGYLTNHQSKTGSSADQVLYLYLM